jgi:hypothetical protein
VGRLPPWIPRARRHLHRHQRVAVAVADRCHHLPDAAALRQRDDDSCCCCSMMANERINDKRFFEAKKTNILWKSGTFVGIK